MSSHGLIHGVTTVVLKNATLIKLTIGIMAFGQFFSEVYALLKETYGIEYRFHLLAVLLAGIGVASWATVHVFTWLKNYIERQEKADAAAMSPSFDASNGLVARVLRRNYLDVANHLTNKPIVIATVENEPVADIEAPPPTRTTGIAKRPVANTPRVHSSSSPPSAYATANGAPPRPIPV